jgi:L-alanine-DL-glutamate epimerase-like enolase superfamily enzyme
MALWDLLGKARGEPVWRLLDYQAAHPKTPYASQLFGDTPAETLASCRAQINAGYRAVKCGWGPFGRGTLAADVDHLHAAREGLGPDGILLVDAGQIFGEDVEAAAARLPALEETRATWYEEPVAGMAYEAYAALAARSPVVKLAGGEAAHNIAMARHTIDYGKVGFIQIDCGRIGGIGPAKKVAEHAEARGVTYVNHTFTSNLALAASLQPMAGLEDHRICEFPVQTKPVAKAFCATQILPDANGEIVLTDAPGLGIDIDPEGIRQYLQDVEIRVGGKTLYRTPDPG